MTPVHNIPAEVLQDIFLFAISDRIPEPDRHSPILFSCHPTYSSSTSPFSISHVCERWRDISINFPELWTHLSIENPKSLDLACLVEEWITRSRSFPLHLALTLTESGADRQYREETKAVLSVFLESFHRCKTFVLHTQITIDDLIDPEHIIQTQHPASLDCVSLRTSENYSLPSIMFLSNLLRPSTLLSIRVLVPFSLQDISTSWDNLQHLIFHESDRGGYSLPQLLSHCPRLKTLEASSLFIGSSPGEITLPYLERMTLKYISFMPTFLMSLKVPALSSLILDCYSPLNDFSIVEMLTKSNATLKSLEINGLIPGYCEVVTILTAPCFTGLETLRLSDMPMPGYVFFGRSNVVWLHVVKLLITSNSSTGTWQYLPHLQHFSLLTQNTDELDPVHLGVVAQSRISVHDPEVIRKHSTLRASPELIDFSFTIPPNLGRENHPCPQCIMYPSP